ncbi:uncharacterized protein LOC143212310 isoform X2 [Lasioglossum baleicum]
MTKRLVAVFLLLLSVAEGRHFWRQWGPPPGHSHFHPGQTFESPGQVCPPGHVQSCSPPAQSQFPPVQPPPPHGFAPGNHQPSPNWNQQQTQFQQNGNLNSAEVGKAEWVCRNPATGDMMVIVGINGGGPPSETGQNPRHVPDTNGNDHRRGNPNDGNLNNGEHTTPQSTNSANEPSLPHGGEGLIDVRLGGLDNK